MRSLFSDRRFGPMSLVLIVMMGTLAVLSPGPVRAEGPLGNSLDWVPAEADVYLSSSRLDEQWKAVRGSTAWKRFREIPAVAQYWQLAEQQLADPNGPLAAAVALMELPENQQLLSVLADMHSHEIVIYGGDGLHKWVTALGELQGVRQWQRLLGEGELEIELLDDKQLQIDEIEVEVEDDCADDELDETDEMDELDEFDVELMGEDDAEFELESFDDGASAGNEYLLRTLLEMLSEDPNLLNVPDMVVAYRLDDVAAFATQLKRLEVLAKLGLRGTAFAEEFTRQKLGEGEFLTLTLDGSQVDWEEQEIPGLSEEDGEFDELRKQLATKKIVVALGHWRNYAMLAVVASPERLARLGTVPALATRPELAPLVEHNPARLASVAYVSEALTAANAMTREDLDGLVQLGKTLLQDARLPGEMITRLHHDMRSLADDLQPLITQPGATMSYSLLNDRGFETFSYDWSQYPSLDATQSLPLTKHVGGNPLLAIVQRAKVDPASYDLLVKWLTTGFRYFEDFGIAQMNEKDRAKAEAYLNELKPLAARADQVTRQKLLPALADGQLAVVVDAKITSKQWHQQMPASAVELPMLEIGLAIGVSDNDLLVEAINEYRQIADDVVAAVKKLEPKSIPADYRISLPEKTQVDGQTVHFYPLPAAAELDNQIAPSGGLARGVLVLSTSTSQVARMLNATDLAVEQATALTGSYAIFGAARWDGMLDAVFPWVDYGMSQAEGSEGQMAQAIWPQVRQALALLKCFKYTEWSSTLKDGALVTHGITVIEDAPLSRFRNRLRRNSK